MLYHFFSICIITIFSVLSGILITVLLDDFGIILALMFYGMMFLTDYTTTTKVKNYQRYETNPLFGIFSKLFSAKISFGIILFIGITINILSYLLIGDVILCYVLGMCHLCAGINNHSISKKLSALQKEPTL